MIYLPPPEEPPRGWPSVGLERPEVELHRNAVDSSLSACATWRPNPEPSGGLGGTGAVCTCCGVIRLSTALLVDAGRHIPLAHTPGLAGLVQASSHWRQRALGSPTPSPIQLSRAQAIRAVWRRGVVVCRPSIARGATAACVGNECVTSTMSCGITAIGRASPGVPCASRMPLILGRFSLRGAASCFAKFCRRSSALQTPDIPRRIVSHLARGLAYCALSRASPHLWRF